MHSSQNNQQKNDLLDSETNRDILDFLQNNPVGVLATVGSDNSPHAATMYFSIDLNFISTFTTKRETTKSNNIRHNNSVMLVVFDAATQTTVQITGSAVPIENSNEHENAIHEMLKNSAKTSEAGVPPIAKLTAGELVTYKIMPKQIKMAVYMRPDTGGYEQFEIIDF
jgi:general stress protein 26